MSDNPLLQAIDYINNGDSPFVAITRFDDDFYPIGPELRAELLKQKAITMTSTTITLADKYCKRSML